MIRYQLTFSSKTKHYDIHKWGMYCRTDLPPESHACKQTVLHVQYCAEVLSPSLFLYA